jgi:hypothetical protein
MWENSKGTTCVDGSNGKDGMMMFDVKKMTPEATEAPVLMPG